MSDIDDLVEFMRRHKKITVLSGAGCSTASGIPAYRDEDGNWKNARPVEYRDFVSDPDVRRAYWARSFAGWSRIACAVPNAAHLALAALEASGHVGALITQNVDDLHRKAGTHNVIDLHGVLKRIRCLACSATGRRSDWQARLRTLNPHWDPSVAGFAPDGDARLSRPEYANIKVPDCAYCGGVIKPDVVFFGESVPPEVVNNAVEQVKRSTALLVVGTSLMVFSGFRFARLAANMDIPIVIVNRGKTRGDALAVRKFSRDCTEFLPRVADRLAA